MMHSSTIAGSIPARRTASATTSAPSRGAVKSFSTPRNLPVGVRTAETMTASRMILARGSTGSMVPGSSFQLPGSSFQVLGSPDRDGGDGVFAEQRLKSSQDDGRRAADLAGPLRRRGVDEE